MEYDIVETSSSVKLIKIHIDNQLKINQHSSNICKLFPRNLFSCGIKKGLIKSFILSNYNCCPLAWYILSAKSLYKVKNLQKRALSFFNNDYSGLFEELSKKPGKTTANVSNYCTPSIEIFKNSQKLSKIQILILQRKLSK